MCKLARWPSTPAPDAAMSDRTAGDEAQLVHISLIAHTLTPFSKRAARCASCCAGHASQFSVHARLLSARASVVRGMIGAEASTSLDQSPG